MHSPYLLCQSINCIMIFQLLANLWDRMRFFGNDMRIASLLLFETFDKWSQLRTSDESSGEIDQILVAMEKRLRKLVRILNRLFTPSKSIPFHFATLPLFFLLNGVYWSSGYTRMSVHLDTFPVLDTGCIRILATSHVLVSWYRWTIEWYAYHLTLMRAQPRGVPIHAMYCLNERTAYK